MDWQEPSQTMHPSTQSHETLPGYSPGPAPVSRLSALAVWSLVLGIVGFFTFIPSIPAVICGHLAHGKIKRSAGALTGKGMAIAGFALGYIGLIFLPLLAIAGFAAGNAAITKAKKVTTLATAVAIETAITNFYMEYGGTPSASMITDTSNDVSLAKTLLGNDVTRNIRNVRFLAVKESRSGRGGLNSTTFQIFDAWGKGYHVVLDITRFAEVTVTRGSITETLKGRGVAVYSTGEDGIAGTADDVKTW